MCIPTLPAKKINVVSSQTSAPVFKKLDMLY